MKINVECLSKQRVKNIFNTKGSGYIDFILGFLVLSAILYIFMQFYFLVHAQILMMNTAKVALRNLEVFGGVVYQAVIKDGVYGSLTRNKNIDQQSIVFTINGRDIRNINDSTWYQIRHDIVVRLEATYNFSAGVRFGIPLSVTYVGSSQRLRKDSNLPDYQPIMN